jgi:hypothetical protein
MCTNEMGNGIVNCGNCGIEYNKSKPDINNYKAQFQASVNGACSISHLRATAD